MDQNEKTEARALLDRLPVGHVSNIAGVKVRRFEDNVYDVNKPSTCVMDAFCKLTEPSNPLGKAEAAAALGI